MDSRDLTIRLAYDYEDTFRPENERTYTSDQIDTLAREWLDREILQSTSQAVKIQLEDAAPTGSGAAVLNSKGGTWVALTVAGHPHRAPKRTSGPQRGGT
jgi:hypothetical protein